MSNGDRDKAHKTLTDLEEILEKTLEELKKALERNPSDDERRAIDERILEVTEQLARVRAKILALIASAGVIQPPTDAQMAAIAELMSTVDGLIAADAGANQFIDVASRTASFVRDNSGIGSV